MFNILNDALENYCFLKQRGSDFLKDNPNTGPFVPDYTCRLINNETYGNKILALEIKRNIILQDLLTV
jgi:hypothetical protein